MKTEMTGSKSPNITVVLRDALKITSLPVIFASLCCLSPVILVLLGLSTVSFASSLADTLYGEYKWYFRGVGLALLAIALVYYFRRTKGICTLDQVKKRRNEIINIVAISFIVAILGYIFFLYVVVHYVGVFLDLWA
jgi:hypothetical protein